MPFLRRYDRTVTDFRVVLVYGTEPRFEALAKDALNMTASRKRTRAIWAVILSAKRAETPPLMSDLIDNQTDLITNLKSSAIALMVCVGGQIPIQNQAI